MGTLKGVNNLDDLRKLCGPDAQLPAETITQTCEPVPSREPAGSAISHGPKVDGILFLTMCRRWELPDPTPEFRFSPPRRWRFDWCWRAHGVALEIQGGLFSGGRHVRGAALLKEHEKLNAAACCGYRVLFCTPADVENEDIFQTLKRALS